MLARPRKVPKPRKHASGQLIATFNGKDEYFGKFGTPEAQAAYDRFVAEWLASGRAFSPAAAKGGVEGPSINELALGFIRHAREYYRKNGEPTRELGNIIDAIKSLRKLYGLTPASGFGPLALKAFRQSLVEEGNLTRQGINRRLKLVKRMFKWGVSEEVIPATNFHALTAVEGLRRGRTSARETDPIKPVPDAFVEAIRPFVSRQVWAMIELQRLTGMRPGEVCIMRTCDLETGGQVWVYRPETHKVEHHGRDRKIFIGPAAQQILKPWLRPALAEYLFQPKEADEERKNVHRAARKSKVQPSQLKRRKANARRKPGDCYNTGSYRRAIAYGRARANEAAHREGWPEIPSWHPNQLRHNVATRLRREFGLDVARVILGHSTPIVTEIYAELDEAKAAQAIAKVG